MQITEIVVSAGRTFNHPFEQFSNLRPNVTLKATLSPEDDPAKAMNELQAMAEKSVEDHKQALLHSIEELHYLTEAQRNMTSLAEQITRSQRQLEEIRKAHPQLSLPDGE
jgi:small-conductance mechanosensitive channel